MDRTLNPVRTCAEAALAGLVVAAVDKRAYCERAAFCRCSQTNARYGLGAANPRVGKARQTQAWPRAREMGAVRAGMDSACVRLLPLRVYRAGLRPPVLPVPAGTGVDIRPTIAAGYGAARPASRGAGNAIISGAISCTRTNAGTSGPTNAPCWGSGATEAGTRDAICIGIESWTAYWRALNANGSLIAGTRPDKTERLRDR